MARNQSEVEDRDESKGSEFMIQEDEEEEERNQSKVEGRDESKGSEFMIPFSRG